MYYSVKRTRINFEDWLSNQQIMIILVILFLTGVVSGSFYTVNEGSVFSSEILKIFKESQIVRAESSFLQLFFHSIRSQLIFFLPIFLFGTCALGAPLAFGVSFFKGLGLGVLSSVIYQNYNIAGLEYNVFILIPGAVLGSAALMFACKEGYYMSLDMFGKLFQNRASGRQKKENSSFKLYCMRFGVLFIFVVLTAIVDSLTNGLLGDFFKL